MGLLTLYGRQLLLDAMFAPDSYVAPSIYFGLTLDIPVDNADGSVLNEPWVGGYARPQYHFGSSYWTPSGFGEIYNAEQISFAVPTADWGTLWSLVIVDSPWQGQGNVVYIGELTDPFDPDDGTAPIVDIGDIVIGFES